MANRKNDKQIDEMLDSLLASYSSAEPRPGLETRILANLRDSAISGTSHGWLNFKWLWAAVIAAGIIIVTVVIHKQQRITAPANVVVKNSQPAPRPEIQPNVPVAGEEIVTIHRHKAVSHAPQQKNATLALDQRPAIFPTPTPFSEQEKLLLSYFARTPQEEKIAQSRPEEPPAGDKDQTKAVPDLTHIPQKISDTQ
jgi:hypothetical protein